MYSDAKHEFGTIKQLDQAVEECSELILSIQKLKRNSGGDLSYFEIKNEGNIQELIGEIADVRIMMAQLELMFGISFEVDKMIGTKLNKLSWYIHENKQKNDEINQQNN